MTVSDHGYAKHSSRTFEKNVRQEWSRGTLDGSVRRGRPKPAHHDKCVVVQNAVTLLKGEASSA